MINKILIKKRAVSTQYENYSLLLDVLRLQVDIMDRDEMSKKIGMKHKSSLSDWAENASSHKDRSKQRGKINRLKYDTVSQVRKFDSVNHVLRRIIKNDKEIEFPDGILGELTIIATQLAYEMCSLFSRERYEKACRDISSHGIYSGPYALASPLSLSPYALLRYWVELYAEVNLDNEAQPGDSPDGNWYVLECTGYKETEKGIVLSFSDAFGCVTTNQLPITRKLADRLTGRLLRVLARRESDSFITVMQIITTPVYADLKTLPCEEASVQRSYVFTDCAKKQAIRSYEDQLYHICFLIRLMNLFYYKWEHLLFMAPYFNYEYTGWGDSESKELEMLREQQTMVSLKVTEKSADGYINNDNLCFIGFSDLWKRLSYQKGPAFIACVDACGKSEKEEYYGSLFPNGSSEPFDVGEDKFAYNVNVAGFYLEDRIKEDLNRRVDSYFTHRLSMFVDVKNEYSQHRRVSNYGAPAVSVIIPMLGKPGYEPVLCGTNETFKKQLSHESTIFRDMYARGLIHNIYNEHN